MTIFQDNVFIQFNHCAGFGTKCTKAHLLNPKFSERIVGWCVFWFELFVCLFVEVFLFSSFYMFLFFFS